MKAVLAQLARAGKISWLSYYFAEFVARYDNSAIDDVIALSAALVSEANRAGDVCIDIESHGGRPWFSDSASDAEAIAPAADEWLNLLENSTCVGLRQPLTLDSGRLYLNRYWHYESAVAERILAKSRVAPVAQSTTADDAPGSGNPEQNAAVATASRHQFSVISGGPGSGKTSTVVRILLKLLQQDPDLRIGLAAPTGRAAARMMESIQRGLQSLETDTSLTGNLPRTASTIHRLLGYRRDGYEHDRNNPLALDCIVIDEASMIDLQLMYHLLEALSANARLILLGDRDQLASVAAGNVLGDITGHGQEPDQQTSPLSASIALLRKNYRFSKDSAIGDLSARVNQGDPDAVISMLRLGQGGLQWHDRFDDRVDAGALKPLLEAYRSVFECNEPAEALQVFTETRMLCATNHGPLGVVELNRQISNALQSDPGSGDAGLFHGLPIMITRNQHELSLYNGDTGVVWQTTEGLRACFADGDGGVRSLSLNRLSDYEPAWAITVHKAQGSEYDSVLLVLPEDADNEVLTRELLYTAITRARKSFRLHGAERAIRAAVARLTRRRSGLAERLGWARSSLD